MKIPYTMCAWILKSIAFPSAQKFSSVNSLYACLIISINFKDFLEFYNSKKFIKFSIVSPSAAMMTSSQVHFVGDVPAVNSCEIFRTII